MDTEGLTGIYNFLALTPALATAGQPSEDELILVARAGFDVVVNLGLTQTDYALADEAGAVAGLKMEYVHIPVPWDAPGQAQLDQFTATLSAQQYRKLFVHCAANKRVSVFVCLHRALCLGWPLSAALADVYRVWTPNSIWWRFIEQSVRRV